MAYFSNGTEGISYQEKYCFNCKNFRDIKDGRGFGCPVFDLHILHLPYKKNLNISDKKTIEILDFLIPRNKKGCYNEKCSMFVLKKVK